MVPILAERTWLPGHQLRRTMVRHAPRTRRFAEVNMDPDYWSQRWQEGRVGWHQGAVLPWLQKHWPMLALDRGSRVLVPLCGKSLDMPWLAARGHQVLGIELVPLAIEQFFADNGLQPRVSRDEVGLTHYTAGSIEVINANVFDVAPATLATCHAIYDRAALIALPPSTRLRYVRHVYASLAPGATGLLITLDYPQHEMPGPPFSVDEQEVRQALSADWHVDRLERRDILPMQPDFAAAGVTSLHTTAYRLRKTRPAQGS